MKLFSLLLVFILPLITNAQNNKNVMVGDLITRRVHFTEKKNVPMRIIPSLLLKAFCAGDIKAYYPQSPDKEVTYEAFLAHFGYEQEATLTTLPTNQTPLDLGCGEVKCLSPDPYLINCLSFYIDIVEHEFFNKSSSKKEREIKYVKLIHAWNCHISEIEYDGPVFKMEDIKKLPAKYFIENPDNQAVKYKLADYLLLNLYNSVVVQLNGKWVENPAKETEKRDKQKTEEENNNYDN